MKQFLLAMVLLANAAPLFANDEGGDSAYIPDYRELVREGYGPRQADYVRVGGLVATTVPKPTQAYYGKGYTVYYGYTEVPVHWSWDPTSLYAFGYPVEFFHHLMPASTNATNLANYAIVLGNQYGNYAPGDYVAQRNRNNAVSTVQSTTIKAATSNGANPLPAIGEKPSH